LLKKNTAINRWRWGVLAFGVSLCLIGAFLMVHGSILGENTTGIATVTGITGLGIIAHANKRIKR
jgi:hypothetical protein